MNLRELFFGVLSKYEKVVPQDEVIRHSQILSFQSLRNESIRCQLPIFTRVSPGPLISINRNPLFAQKVKDLFHKATLFKSKDQLIAHSDSNFSIVEKGFILHLTVIDIHQHLYLEIGVFS